MAARTRAGRSAVEYAAYEVLGELGFPLPVDVRRVCTYLGLEVLREAALPARIRGVLDLHERLIVIREGLPRPAEEHVVLHEGGHYHLPHHRALFYRCSAFDLEADVRRRLEAEANTWATVLRFGAVPEEWVDAEPPSITRVSALADMAGASFEAALRWFVQRSSRAVWALVCEAPGVADEPGSGTTMRVRYGYRSPAARPEPWPALLETGAPRTSLHRGANGRQGWRATKRRGRWRGRPTRRRTGRACWCGRGDAVHLLVAGRGRGPMAQRGTWDRVHDRVRSECVSAGG